MFKRVVKRHRRKEEEERLGIDSDVKQVLGLQDTGSDESDSESSDGGERSLNMGETTDSEEGEGDDSSDGEIVPDQVSDGFGDDNDGKGDGAPLRPQLRPQLTLAQALQEPLYVLNHGQDAKGCIVCPKKTFKTDVVAQGHIASKAHVRRLKRFTSQAGVADLQSDAWDFVAAHEANSPFRSAFGVSKRAQKASERAQMILAKRAAAKQAKAKRAARRRAEEERKVASPGISSHKDILAEPLKKRRKANKGSHEADSKKEERFPKPSLISTPHKLSARPASLESEEHTHEDKLIKRWRKKHEERRKTVRREK